MTEKLFTGTLNKNQKKKYIYIVVIIIIRLNNGLAGSEQFWPTHYGLRLEISDIGSRRIILSSHTSKFAGADQMVTTQLIFPFVFE